MNAFVKIIVNNILVDHGVTVKGEHDESILIAALEGVEQYHGCEAIKYVKICDVPDNIRSTTEAVVHCILQNIDDSSMHSYIYRHKELQNILFSNLDNPLLADAYKYRLQSTTGIKLYNHSHLSRCAFVKLLFRKVCEKDFLAGFSISELDALLRSIIYHSKTDEDIKLTYNRYFKHQVDLMKLQYRKPIVKEASGCGYSNRVICRIDDIYQAGCFTGSKDELISKVSEKYKGSEILQDYLDKIDSLDNGGEEKFCKFFRDGYLNKVNARVLPYLNATQIDLTKQNIPSNCTWAEAKLICVLNGISDADAIADKLPDELFVKELHEVIKYFPTSQEIVEKRLKSISFSYLEINYGLLRNVPEYVVTLLKNKLVSNEITE